MEPTPRGVLAGWRVVLALKPRIMTIAVSDWALDLR
jgi:hypothetical protein